MLKKHLKPAFAAVLFVFLIVLSGCGSSGWLIDDVQLESKSVYFSPVAEEVIRLDEHMLHPTIISELKGSVVDSLALSAMERVIAVYTQPDMPEVNMAENAENADIEFRIEELSIRRVRTLNMVHPGPVFRIRVTMSGWEQGKKVFEQRHSTDSNLAVKAAQGARFYVPDSEEERDIELQRLTLYPSLRSVFGQLWQDVLDENRLRY